MSERVLVISPHPDDESIGCGGTIRRHVVAGDAVHVIFLTSGEKGGHGRSEAETIVVRERESRAAQRILGYESLDFYHAPDAALRRERGIVARLTQKMQDWRPSVSYVPHEREMHRDHRAAVRIVKSAMTRIPRSRRPVTLMYEVWTPLTHLDEIVDITPFIAIKRRAIRAYRTQCAVLDFEAAIIGLNRYRGEMFSWPEGEYAEVFARMKV